MRRTTVLALVWSVLLALGVAAILALLGVLRTEHLARFAIGGACVGQVVLRLGLLARGRRQRREHDALISSHVRAKDDLERFYGRRR